MNIDAQHKKILFFSNSTITMWCSQPQLPFLDVSYFLFQLHGKLLFLPTFFPLYFSPSTLAYKIDFKV